MIRVLGLNWIQWISFIGHIAVFCAIIRTILTRPTRDRIIETLSAIIWAISGILFYIGLAAYYLGADIPVTLINSWSSILHLIGTVVLSVVFVSNVSSPSVKEVLHGAISKLR